MNLMVFTSILVKSLELYLNCVSGVGLSLAHVVLILIQCPNVIFNVEKKG